MAEPTPHPLNVIRAICTQEHRDPIAGEVMTLDGTTTRVIAVKPATMPGLRRVAWVVTFTCTGAEDISRSAGIVRKRSADYLAGGGMTQADFPIGTIVRTTVHGIGGRSELVSGEVVDHRRRSLIVATECHGKLVVAPADAHQVAA